MRSCRNWRPLRSLALAAAALAALTIACSGEASRIGLPASFDLVAGGSPPPNSAMASLNIFGNRSAVALMNSMGAPYAEAVIPFDPLTGRTEPSVTTRKTLTLNPPLPNKDGVPVSTTVTSYPAFAAVASDKLYVTMSDLDASFVYNPGAVLVYDYDLSRNRLGAFRSAIVTAHGGETYYNPTSIVPFARAGGPTELAVVCADSPFAATVTAAVLVIDPATDAIVEAVSIGATSASAGQAALGPGPRLYVGSSRASEIYVVDLSTAPPTVEHGASDPVAIPTASPAWNSISALAVSEDGSELHALNFNDATLTVFSLASPADPARRTQTAAFRRSVLAGVGFGCDPMTLALRPGRPGIDFTGPDLAVGTITILDPADQVLPGVQTAVDAVTTYRGPLEVKLDALVSPFTSGADIQHLVAPSFSALRGAFYALEGQTGKVVVGRFADLR